MHFFIYWLAALLSVYATLKYYYYRLIKSYIKRVTLKELH